MVVQKLLTDPVAEAQTGHTCHSKPLGKRMIIKLRDALADFGENTSVLYHS